MMNSRNSPAQDMSTMNKQDEIRPENTSYIFQTDTAEDKTSRILPQSNSQRQLKRYHRTQSETNVSHQARGNTARLQRALSATELRTRLAGCPPGLLITTEPPKSGETYRRRSNTDIKAIPAKNLTPSSNDHLVQEGSYQKNNDLQQAEKETILLELEAVKRERDQLQKENERLQEELENRNKVIDHLIDFMKSSLPEEREELTDDFNETLTNSNNRNRMQSFEKV